MASIPTDPADLELLSTLASLRLALPVTLLGVLLLRFAARAFTGIVAHIQAGGWVDDGSNPLYDALPITADEDEIHPVVVKVKKTRRGLVLSLYWLVGATFVGDGIAQSEFRRWRELRSAPTDVRADLQSSTLSSPTSSRLPSRCGRTSSPTRSADFPHLSSAQSQ